MRHEPTMRQLSRPSVHGPCHQRFRTPLLIDIAGAGLRQELRGRLWDYQGAGSRKWLQAAARAPSCRGWLRRMGVIGSHDFDGAVAQEEGQAPGDTPQACAKLKQMLIPRCRPSFRSESTITQPRVPFQSCSAMGCFPPLAVFRAFRRVTPFVHRPPATDLPQLMSGKLDPSTRPNADDLQVRILMPRQLYRHPHTGVKTPPPNCEKAPTSQKLCPVLYCAPPTAGVSLKHTYRYVPTV